MKTENTVYKTVWENRSRARRNLAVKHALTHVCLITIATVFVFPFVWLVSSSLKSLTEASTLSLDLIPEKIMWQNYVDIFRVAPFGRYLLNTLFLAGVNVIGCLISCSVVAYALTHIDWKGKKILFPIIMATMLLPSQVTLIPVYIINYKLKLIGSFWPLIIPGFLAVAPVYVFLMRQFFLSLPSSVMQAARIDGASHFRIYTTIVVPLSKSVFTAVGVFVFLNNWNDFMTPMLYLNRPEMFTISIGLKSYIGEHNIEWHYIMAASTIATLPIIIIYFFAQKQFIEGIAMTGVKG